MRPRAEVVRPDQAVVAHGLAQQFHDAIHHAAPERLAVQRQFGHVAKRRLDQDLDGRAVEPLAKGPQPGRVGRFAGGQHHGTDSLRPVRDQVRRGEFDDAPHAAGTEVVMDDDQLQRAECHTRPAPARTFLNLGFLWGVIVLT